MNETSFSFQGKWKCVVTSCLARAQSILSLEDESPKPGRRGMERQEIVIKSTAFLCFLISADKRQREMLKGDFWGMRNSKRKRELIIV